MAETTNIAKMAEILSKDVFNTFLWQQVGPMNTNWACEEPERHGAKTHPSDIVFWYDNPYSQSRTYVNCDLKSYASGSIKSLSISSSLESLARAVRCAEKSANWQKRFLHEHVNHDICGLLFLYNHDGAYDRNFKRLLEEASPNLLELPKKSKLIVFGPEDIFWLNNIHYEIIQLRGKKELPTVDNCKFFYPHLSLKNNVQLASARAATVEMLTSPWVILSYEHPAQTKSQNGYLIFSKSKGSTVSEYTNLIDYLMHYQVIVENSDVTVKTLGPERDAVSNFQKAIDEYVDASDKSADIKKRLESIKYSEIREVHTKFSEIEIGMNHA